ncbi:serine hydrolase domain-containing protein [Spongiivirga sp. MCCC 1A20706]|uniref:serine hydrolase domain-containing protein n=1 Tax=Spongiivirga sp. MCCC 1A20706 TaxID=3160963 RepID=UPI003977BAD2
MKLFWKILLGIIGLVVICIIAFAIWFYNAELKVASLEISPEENQLSKVAKADAWLAKMQADDKFNGGVLLIKNDSVLLKKAYGFTDHTATAGLNTESAFRLASVSKQFTATGIMILKEKDSLDFDDPITKFFPELSYTDVTLRMLLNHTSGIPDVYMNFPDKYPDKVGDLLTNEKVVKLLAKENPPYKNEPNSKYEYSNLGYVLLSATIEKVSGQSFEDFMKVELFDPLGMKNTRVWNLLSDEKTFKNKTSSFVNFGGRKEALVPEILDGVSGDGAVFSSLDDFVIWNQFWYENNILSEETIKEAFKTPTLINAETSNYGFGWRVTPSAVMHNGSWLGARTTIIRNFELKNCLVILDNSSSLHIDRIGQELVKVFK